MTTLVACLSTGKGTWGHVSRLIEGQEWDKVILITNEFGKENFKKNDKTELIIIDPNKEIKEIREEIQIKLKELIKDLEIALNIVSGSGKEHMALLSALLKLGLGINLTTLAKEGIEEI
jgi:hypothetical protein